MGVLWTTVHNGPGLTDYLMGLVLQGFLTLLVLSSWDGEVFRIEDSPRTGLLIHRQLSALLAELFAHLPSRFCLLILDIFRIIRELSYLAPRKINYIVHI